MATIAVPTGTLTCTGALAASGEEAFAAGQSLAPLVWAELENPDASITVHAPVALADAAAYYQGFKAADLLSAGRIRRALSDDEGEYEVQQFDVTLSDMGRTWRTYLGQPSASTVVLNKRILVRLVSDTWRRVQLRPRTVAIGLIRGYTLG